MSAFDNYLKDEITESIKSFIEDKKGKQPDIQIHELVKETMEAVSHGLEQALWNIENKA